MNTRLPLISAAALFLCLVPVGTSAQTPKPTPEIAGEDTASDLSVAVGKSVLVDLAEPIKRVAVGLSDIAEATVTSATEIMVNGKTPGQTSLIIWQASGDRQFFNITVRRNTFETSDRLAAIRHELSISLPGQDIQVGSENGSIFLRGTVDNLGSSERAVQIASTALAPIGNADTTGKTSDGASQAAAGKVVNLLYVRVPPAERQILLKVRFASLDRNKARQLGINLYNLGLGNAIGGVTTGQFSPPTVSSPTSINTGTVGGTKGTAQFSNELNILSYFPGLNVGADIQALETKGIVQILAQPNVLAVNGKQASFLAGGEYPYPVVQPSATGSSVTISFKEYGIRLNFIPTITPRGTIRLQVAPEVSALDFTNQVQLGGFTVPAITVRKVNTEVELSDKESFVIGGLLQDTESRVFDKIPFIGDIPILGKFFQSQQKSQTHTELLVIVTPEMVDPILTGSPTPSLKFPDKFLSSDSPNPTSTPDLRSPLQQEPTAIPVESLVQSQKPGQPLAIEGSMGGVNK